MLPTQVNRVASSMFMEKQSTYILLSTVYEMYGWIAGGLSAAHNFPQIWHVYRRKSAKDISAWALVVRILSLGFYIVHGHLIEDLALTVMSSFILLQCVVLCILKYIFSDYICCTHHSMGY